jgi:hypothetical protein
MMNSESLFHDSPPEPFVSDFLKSFGSALLLVSWGEDEVNAALSFIRRRLEAGRSLAEALIEVYKLKDSGRLTPNA